MENGRCDGRPKRREVKKRERGREREAAYRSCLTIIIIGDMDQHRSRCWRQVDLRVDHPACHCLWKTPNNKRPRKLRRTGQLHDVADWEEEVETKGGGGRSASRRRMCPVARALDHGVVDHNTASPFCWGTYVPRCVFVDVYTCGSIGRSGSSPFASCNLKLPVEPQSTSTALSAEPTEHAEHGMPRGSTMLPPRL